MSPITATTPTDGTAAKARPWYREPLVWLLMVPPAGAVVGGFITAWLAGGPPEMVVRDETELAVQTNQSFIRDRSAVLAREAERREARQDSQEAEQK